ncbi:trehalose synthase [Stella humosa]|uniref:Maltokinase n=1 Tax=Stella humosa TaxID=94 RepID=A0A3N1MED6_9PROT|nr:maltose alpha-D-glucosyltransferase [Stella humosa]ROQ01057.1 trehalose synthase [Stella humosa]BBK31428.1 trehalose synthase [Stella humosa]
MNAPLLTRAPAIEQDPLWYKDAIIYQLHVKSFFDANDDGIGDFPGLISKLDYIAELGANTIWLLPFYPSPRLDDGYDISEYRAIHPDYGTMADVKRFIAAAHARGLRVVTELVVNHTSDRHPWFQRARRAKPGSAHRDFYVWSDDDKRYDGTRIIFLDTERSNWTWDPVAGAYFWHRFYSHQPDLNFDNPAVVRAILGVMRYWLDMGIDGLRLDAVPYLIERDGTNNENLPETHEILRRFRTELDAHYSDRMLLAEANQWPEDTKDYFGEGDECHMAFHFPLMPRMYMALAREDRFPITDIMRQTPEIPAGCQWAIFLRNHDELTLEMVTDSERDYLWETYAADRRARINLGIRRRLAPLLERDRRRVELMNCLLLSMPGTPVIYYGDEIGMGDNIHLGDRDGVRTPMQWSPDRNGGFSRADPASLVLPAIMDPLYGHGAVNVEAQRRDPHSLLNWMRRMLAVRRQHAVFGRGRLHFLYPRNRKVLAYLRAGEGETILCVANVSRSPQAVELDLSEFAGRVPIELSGGSVFPPVGNLPYLLTLPPYGFYWFILAAETEWPTWHVPAPEPMPEYRTLVMRGTLADALAGAHRDALEREILPTYLAMRRWFSAKDQKIASVRLEAVLPMPAAGREMALAVIETGTGEQRQRWSLPLAAVDEAETGSALPGQLALARTRRGRSVGLLTDAFAVAEFAHGLLAAIQAGRGIGEAIRCAPAPDLAAIDIPGDAEVTWISAEQSNSSLLIGAAAMLKLFRRLVPGIHPEAEMGRHLTAAGYANCAPLLGEVVYVGTEADEPASLAILQGFIRNQGDAWAWMLDLLSRAVDAAQAPEGEGAAPEHIATCVAFASTIGRRLGEMHAILSQPSDDPAFAPEVAGHGEAKAWGERAAATLDAAFAALPADVPEAAGLADRRAALKEAVKTLAQAAVGTPMIRVHGDFHLGQVLVANGDAYLIDFEGEPARPLAERRAKTSALRDVAGLLRSFDYAAATVERKHPTTAEADAAGLMARFRAESAAAFLAAYGEVVGPGSVQPALLDCFLIEKAAYEIAYEAANRPTWLDVPVAGMAALASRILDGRDG